MCEICKKGELVKSTLPRVIEDLGGLKVELINSVYVFTCTDWSEQEVEIPAFENLVLTAAIVRALTPVKLTGQDLKFFRRALDMKQADFAAAMDITIETLSRWENAARGIAISSEKLMRHNVCALLHSKVPFHFDPAVLVRMKLVEAQVPVLKFELTKFKTDHQVTQGWDSDLMAA
jgi:DNA-binding transcriptional regulator YiaG